MTQLTALIAAICIHTTQIDTKEQKIACIDYWTNCTINGKTLDECRAKEPKWKKLFY